MQDNQGIAAEDLSCQTHNDEELAGADLQKKTLNFTTFRGAVMVRANLSKSKGKLTDFQKADLTEADFEGSELVTPNFERAILKGARFNKASMSNARFRGADLEGALFHDADLRDADFIGALNIEKAEFRGANLRGTWITPFNESS